mmetsp:Transcript_33872/g.56870  ORF Transcript_33872/g.56870 Transcript_33872/m.56870 type:complete len:201 (-) Transcript_33872:731-1333(-)
MAILGGLPILVLWHFDLAEGRPKLDRLQSHIFLILAHGLQRQVEHVTDVLLHVLVVLAVDAHQALERGATYPHISTLRRLASDLHDVVALRILLEIGVGESQGVEEGIGSCETHFVVRLFFADALNHCGQNLIRDPLIEPLRAQLLAGVPQSIQGGLFRLRIAHVLQQGGDELGPDLKRDLDGGHLGHHLRTRVTRLLHR